MATLAEGFLVRYSPVRQRQALRMTPGEAVGITFEDGFGWRAIMKGAAKLTPRNETREENSQSPPNSQQCRFKGAVAKMPLCR